MLDGVDSRRRAAFPDRCRQEPDRELCPGPVEANCIETALAQARGDRMEGLVAVAPGGDRVVLVEAADVHQFFREPGEGRVTSEVREDQIRPGLGWEGHYRPVDEPLVDDHESLLEIGKLIAAGALRIDAVEDPGRDPRDEDDPRGVHIA